MLPPKEKWDDGWVGRWSTNHGKIAKDGEISKKGNTSYNADPACQGIQIRSCPTPQVKGIGGVIEMLRAVLGDAP